MEEHPVALAIISRSPNNCESNFRYGVSPQPAQASENSNNGCRNCVPRTVPKSTLDRSAVGRLSKKAMSERPESSRGSRGSRLMALRVWSVESAMGHASTHSPQPVQSSR